MKNKLIAVLSIWSFLLALPAGNALASGEANVKLEPFPYHRLKDNVALQNGAKIFANYCLSCHSANLMRWNRLTEIGLDEKQIKSFLIFGDQKVGDTMTIAMTPKDARVWLGKAPPDLSVIVRARTSFEYRGTDYLYTLLRGYYRDASAATGWNNVAYPNIAMPHILWERQGPRSATIDKVAAEVVKDAKGKEKEVFVRTTSVYAADGNATVTRTELQGHAEPRFDYSFKPADPKAAEQVDNEVADLVAFLAFVTEPNASKRTKIGVWALLFLTVFTACAWWLNRVYWKNIE